MRSIAILLLYILIWPQSLLAAIIPQPPPGIQNETMTLTARPFWNFTGAGVNCIDNAGANRTDCTIGSSTYNPLEYGAVCNGSTDDATYLQAMLDDIYIDHGVAGGAVQFPIGDCRSSTALYSGVANPINAAFSTGTSGGSLAAGTYWYRVTATNALGETLPSWETSQIVDGTGNDDTVVVNWTKVTGATGYKIYGRTTGAELLIASVGDVSTYTDTGSITPSGALSTANTTGTRSLMVSGFGAGVSSLTFTANTSGLQLAFGSFTQYGSIKNLAVYTRVNNANSAIRLAWPDNADLANQPFGHHKICNVTDLEVSGSPDITLRTPVNAAFSTSTTGGTLAAGTYYYRVVATNAIGGTLGSTETSQATTGSTSTVTINWTQVPNATGYKVYGRTTGAEQLMATWNGSSWSVGSGDADTWTDTGAITPSGALPTIDTAAASWMVGLQLDDAWQCFVYNAQFRGRYNDPNPGKDTYVVGSRGIQIGGATIDPIFHTLQFNSYERAFWCCSIGAGDGAPGAEGIQIQNIVVNRALQGVHIFSDVAVTPANSPWVSITSSHFNTTADGVALKNRYEVIVKGNLFYEQSATNATQADWSGISLQGCYRCIVSENIFSPLGDGGATFYERGVYILSGLSVSDSVIVTGNIWNDQDAGSDSTPLLYVAASQTNILAESNRVYNGALLGGTVTPITITDNMLLTAYTSSTLPAVANGSAAYCSNCNPTSSTCAGASTGAMGKRVNGGWRCD